MIPGVAPVQRQKGLVCLMHISVFDFDYIYPSLLMTTINEFDDWRLLTIIKWRRRCRQQSWWQRKPHILHDGDDVPLIFSDDDM